MLHGFRLSAAWALALLLCCGIAVADESSPRLPASQISMAESSRAADLLFGSSDLDGARAQAARVLRRHPHHIDALFLTMEAAALEGDTTAEIESAVRLCESRVDDPRVTIAAARLLNLAENTPIFRAVASRVRVLAKAKGIHANYFRAALLAAAADGMPGEQVAELARWAGYLTKWRMAGPFGRFANVDFERAWAPERDGLAAAESDGKPIEEFRFAEGNVSLPEYFTRGGVYYAVSQTEITRPADFLLRAESAGTLEVSLDGQVVLRKDDRFHSTPGTAASRIHLTAGEHHVLVKFLSSASPFRVAIISAESNAILRKAAGLRSATEAGYVAAAQKYWSGDYAGAIAELNSANGRSAAHHFLLAQAWAHAENSEAAEVVAALRAAVEASPRALTADAWLASIAYSADQVDEALERLRRVLAARPNLLPAQELLSEIAIHQNWQSEATQAMDARRRLHPNCATLQEALKFYSRTSQIRRSAGTMDQLQSCTPGSLAYAEALSDTGRHAESARALSAVVAERPLDREARYMLVRELRLAGNFAAAAAAATELAKLAPNCQHYQKLAKTAATQELLEDDESGRGAEFVTATEFYVPYRRDAFDILARTKTRRFSGGPAVILLNDRVVRRRDDGSLSVYVHKITRLLTRDGIERYGEVTIPEGADLLELRTLKADSTVAEPEFLEHKASISMPALAPGDAIEQEYVERVSASGAEASLRFVFGSFEAPILFSSFVVLSPTGLPAAFTATAGAPDPQVQQGGAVRVWEKNDIAQSVEETGMPRGDVLPTVRVFAAGMSDWSQVRDYYRELLIGSTRVGSRVEQAARTAGGTTAVEKAQWLYRRVMSSVRSSSGNFTDGTLTAEDTLAAGQGSRSMALLALARAAGIPAELVLAREVGAAEADRPSLGTFNRPLVRFVLDGKELFVDAEGERSAFGVVPPALDRRRALLVPLAATGSNPIFVAIADSPEREQSVAKGEVYLEDNGDLAADLTITMGASRGAQMRSILGGIPAAGRQHFFEQLAMRIFPGASDVRGEVEDEQDSGRPLVLHVSCRSPRFVSFSGRAADIDQLAPALNLRKMYVGAGERHFSLYLDAPLFESATFRLHLPPGVRVLHRADDLQEQTDFGDYSVHFREAGPEMLEVTRTFHIPVQVIAPGNYPAFARFAARIDDAERQRLTLEKVDTGSHGGLAGAAGPT